MKIREILEGIINEVPLPPDWDSSQFKVGQKSSVGKKVTFSSVVKYAKERAKTIGSGSSRVAFEIEFEGRPSVLKIAKNAKGLAQNEKESDWSMYNSYGNVIIPLIDTDEENDPPTWLQFEKANKMTAGQFKQLTGFKFTDFTNELINYDNVRRGRRVFIYQVPDKVKERLYKNELFTDLADLCVNYDVIPGDFTTVANWGVFDGRPVIIDIGFDTEVYKLYYPGRKY